MMNRLVLFDVDRTLIQGSRGHHTAFSNAFNRVYGVDTTINIINPHGMTDQQIIIEVLKKSGLDEKMIKLKIKECMEAMIESFNKSVEQDEIIVLNGVKELLEKLNKHNILMGLVTGNLEQIARDKMRKIGLNHYFKVGGFGSDDINRTNLVKLAIKRAEENFSFNFDNNVFLFGDAPQDMKAGKEAGVRTIGITTGIYSKEQLENVGADIILKNLEDTNRIIKMIL